MAVFFIALVALGIATSADYGQPWDEPWEQDILRLNGNQYAAAFGLEGRFAMRSDMPAPCSGLIADSEERDHGECAYYPLLWLMDAQTISEPTRMLIWHAYTWLLFVGGAAALWLICRRLSLSPLLSSVATLLLVLSPRMFAEGHYNNKDVVLLSLVLATVWLALRLMERPTPMRAIWFSLAGAAAANTKIIGLLVWGLCALFVLFRQIAGRNMRKHVWVAAGTALVAFCGFYLLLTPAMWGDPPGYLRYVLQTATDFTRWQNFVLFRGTIFHLKYSRLPRYYLPYMILVTTPLWALALVLLGQVCAIGRWLRRKSAPLRDDQAMALMLCSLLWLVPLLYVVIAQPTTYNGWRHFYFLYGPMLVLAAYGLRCAFVWLAARKSQWPRRVAAGLLALCMGATGAGIAINHPNQYAYYNCLITGKDLPGYLELDYWNVSVLETLNTLLAQVPEDQSLTVTGSEYWSHTGLKYAMPLLSPADQARVRVLPLGSLGADYMLVNSTYAVLGYWRPSAVQTVAVETQSFGVPLCRVYHRNDR